MNRAFIVDITFVAVSDTIGTVHLRFPKPLLLLKFILTVLIKTLRLPLIVKA